MSADDDRRERVCRCDGTCSACVAWELAVARSKRRAMKLSNLEDGLVGHDDCPEDGAEDAPRARSAAP